MLPTSLFPASRAPSPVVLHSDRPVDDEPPTVITSIGGLVRSAVDLARRDPYVARDILRGAAEVLRQRAARLSDSRAVRLVAMACDFERAADSGDVSHLLAVAGVKARP